MPAKAQFWFQPADKWAVIRIIAHLTLVRGEKPTLTEVIRWCIHQADAMLRDKGE
jgi:hypothetical protein